MSKTYRRRDGGPPRRWLAVRAVSRPGYPGGGFDLIDPSGEILGTYLTERGARRAADALQAALARYLAAHRRREGVVA